MGGWYYIWTAFFWIVVVAYFALAGVVAVLGFRDIRRLFSTLDAADQEDAEADVGEPSS